ncbi:MAG: alpha/beta hydrolase-fold protein [Pseudomonadota bacterium]
MNNTLHHRHYEVARRTVRLRHDSEVLAGNPWEDPTSRELCVYLPPGYHEGDQRYPVVWYLAAYTNSGASAPNWRGFEENVFSRVDRLIRGGEIGPVIVAAPDCFTTLGGNQYVDSPSLGRYASYLHRELIPLLDGEFRTRSGREHRAVVGKSSGGFGALHSVMRFPQYWGAVASHAGDVGFGLVYQPEFPLCAQRLTAAGSVDKFLRQFWATEKRGAPDFAALMCLCLAASYDPNPQRPTDIQLPFSLDTLEIDAQRWDRWCAFDPLTLVEEYADPLKSLQAVYIDVGDRDEYRIQYGSRRLSKRLSALGVQHHYEEFQGTHRRLDHRLDMSLPMICEAIGA